MVADQISGRLLLAVTGTEENRPELFTGREMNNIHGLNRIWTAAYDPEAKERLDTRIDFDKYSIALNATITAKMQ